MKISNYIQVLVVKCKWNKKELNAIEYKQRSRNENK